NDPSNGGFQINGSNQAVPVATSLSLLTVSSVFGANVGSADVQATIANVGTGMVGLVADWNSATQSGYALLVSSSQGQLVKVANGAITNTLFSLSMSVGSGSHTLELQANSDALTGYLDGQLLFSLVDPTANLYTSGSAGMAALGGSGAALSSFSLYGH